MLISLNLPDNFCRIWVFKPKHFPYLKIVTMSIPKYTLNYYAFNFTFNFTFKLIFIALIALILSGCGGSTGFAPVVTGIKAQSLQYGRTATILIGGKDLRSSLVVDSAGGCDAPSFASNSST